jgi:hypothetical protein
MSTGITLVANVSAPHTPSTPTPSQPIVPEIGT